MAELLMTDKEQTRRDGMDMERDVEQIRQVLDYPNHPTLAGREPYALAVEALNRLAADARRAEWDDAIHIAAPWESRSSLCGNWNRNLVSLTDPTPDSASGCWTCLIAAEWLDKR